MIATQDLIHALPWPVCCLDAEGKHRFANRAYESLCGQSMSDIIGRSLLQVWPGEVGLRLEFDRTEMMKQGGARRKEELWALPEADRWFDVTWKRLSPADEIVVVLALHDIDRPMRAAEEAHRAKRALEETVRERTAALQATNEELESFAYSVSHDLRAPMRAIEGFAELLLHEGPSQTEQREWLSTILTASQQSQQMMARLLELSRLQHAPLARESVRLEHLFEEVKRDLAVAWGPESLDAVHLKAAPDAALYVDRTLFRLVLTNLVGNALKFTRQSDSPDIRVSLMTSAEGGTLLEVRDNGVGFDQQQASRLFGAFQRLHSQNEFAGSGVGLSIVRRIVHRHCGRIHADSQPGRGATFTILLPADSNTGARIEA